MGRWFYNIDALHPSGNGAWTVGLSERHFKLLQSKGDLVSLARLRLARDVLEQPDSIYQGWGREQPDGFVYVGFPNIDLRKPEIEVPADRRFLFLVFVLSDGTLDLWTCASKATMILAFQRI